MTVHTTSRILEFRGGSTELMEGLCVHPHDPPKMREVMAPYMETRRKWLHRMAERGLWVAVAHGAQDEKQGLVECVPIEWAAEPVRGEGSLFVNCLWVLPRYWKSGVARALMERVLSRTTCGGITVLGYEGDRWFGYFRYMPTRFFKHFGFREVDRDGSRVLLHLDLGGAHTPSLITPSLITPRVRNVLGAEGRHVVELLYSSQCPWSGWMIDGVARNLRKSDVDLRLINTDERSVLEEYGLTRGVCVDGQPLIKRMASGNEVVRTLKRFLSQERSPMPPGQGSPDHGS